MKPIDQTDQDRIRAAAAQSYSQTVGRGTAAGAGARGTCAQCVGARRRRHGQPTLCLTRLSQAQEERALEVRR